MNAAQREEATRLHLLLWGCGQAVSYDTQRDTATLLAALLEAPAQEPVDLTSANIEWRNRQRYDSALGEKQAPDRTNWLDTGVDWTDLNTLEKKK